MNQPITIDIGRDFNSVAIPKEAQAVSRHHARLIIYNENNWVLEDTQSTNGTFIEHPDGTLEQVFTRQRVRPSTVIVLGAKRVDGFRFVAGSVKSPDGRVLASPWPEMWGKLQYDYAQFKEKEKKARQMYRYGTYFRNSSSLIAMVLCFGLDNPMWVKLIMGISPFVANMLVSMLTDKRESLNEERRKIMVCPRCGRPLSAEHISYGQCPACKCSMVS